MNNKIVVIDYGLGNLASVANALRKLEIPYQISSDVDTVKNAKAIILPGDGAAGQGMKNLKKSNLDKLIIEEIKNGKPFLGICLGMQLLLSFSEENSTKCFAVIKGNVRKFKTKLKIPLIGWNNVKIKNTKSKIMKKVPNNSYFYFIHSYVCIPDDKSVIAGITNYDEDFCSVFEKDNVFAVQFHPEKSGKPGLQMLKNFWEATCR